MLFVERITVIISFNAPGKFYSEIKVFNTKIGLLKLRILDFYIE